MQPVEFPRYLGHLLIGPGSGTSQSDLTLPAVYLSLEAPEEIGKCGALPRLPEEFLDLLGIRPSTKPILAGTPATAGRRRCRTQLDDILMDPAHPQRVRTAAGSCAEDGGNRPRSVHR